MNSLASFWAIVVRLLQVKFLRWRKWFSQPPLMANSSSLLSLTVAYICFSITLIILQNTLSWRAHLLITHPCMFISSSSLAFFLRPPGSLALLLSSSDRHWSSVWFFRQFLTLLVSTEKHLAAASPEFSSAYFKMERLNFKSYFLFFCCNGDHQCDINWQKAAQHVKKA